MPKNLNHRDRAAQAEAKRRGLLLLIEPKPGNWRGPTWLLYSRRSGEVLLTYFPRQRRWLGPRGKGSGAGTWPQAIDEAARLDGLAAADRESAAAAPA